MSAPAMAATEAPAAFQGTLTDKLREQFDEGLLSGQSLRPDFTIEQPVHRYTSTDHAIWRKLYFEHLANRRFPASWWMRKPEQLDYLQEPDCFHDVFGHVPLLINPVFADYMEAYGKGGLKAAGMGALDMLSRLYWYTVEFGLIRTGQGLRIYGAGILSSQGESIYSLDSASPNRIGFDVRRIMRTRYRIDTFQKTYFVIDSFEQLFDATRPDFAPLYQELRAQPTLGAGDVVPGDQVINAGTREGWADTDDI
ncbi:phenylalanine-4-hydroxylase [compost metagenome]